MRCRSAAGVRGCHRGGKAADRVPSWKKNVTTNPTSRILASEVTLAANVAIASAALQETLGDRISDQRGTRRRPAEAPPRAGAHPAAIAQPRTEHPVHECRCEVRVDQQPPQAALCLAQRCTPRGVPVGPGWGWCITTELNGDRFGVHPDGSRVTRKVVSHEKAGTRPGECVRMGRVACPGCCITTRGRGPTTDDPVRLGAAEDRFHVKRGNTIACGPETVRHFRSPIAAGRKPGRRAAAVAVRHQTVVSR